MNRKSEVVVGASAGLVVGITVRVVISLLSPQISQECFKSRVPAEVAGSNRSNTAAAEIRQAAERPSAEAQAAVASGAVKFIIRGSSKSDETEVARILMDLGAAALCQEGEKVMLWDSDVWKPITTLDQLSGYAIGRAWEVANHAALGRVGDQVSRSAQLFLLLPADQELRLTAAVEKVLPSPLANHSQIEIVVERSQGGHVRWTLHRVVRRDSGDLLLDTKLPI